MTTATPPIRYLIRRDMREVLAIDGPTFGVERWPDEEFRARFRQRNVIGMVAEGAWRTENGESPVLGFMVYGLHRTRLEILRLAVHPDHRLRGVGRALLAKIEGKLSSHRRTRATLAVGDLRTDAHLWLRACGWRATGVDRGEGGGRDRYRFEVGLAGPEPPRLPPVGERPRFAGWPELLARELGEFLHRRPDLGPQVGHLMRLLAEMPRVGPLPLPDVRVSTASIPPVESVRVEWTVGRQVVSLVGDPWQASLLCSPPIRSAADHAPADFAARVAAALARLHGLPTPPVRYVFEEDDRSC